MRLTYQIGAEVHKIRHRAAVAGVSRPKLVIYMDEQTFREVRCEEMNDNLCEIIDYGTLYGCPIYEVFSVRPIRPTSEIPEPHGWKVLVHPNE